MTTEDDIWRDLLAALEQPSEHEDGTLTTQEAMVAWGCTEYTARKRLRELFRIGHVKPERVIRRNIWGISIPVNGWRVCAEPLAGA